MATDVIHYSDISQTLRDVTDNKYRDLRRPRKVKFFCNGDRYFKGKQINITPHRFITFNDLLNDLTSKLPMSMQLSYGVRQIYTPVGGHRIRDIDSLRDGRVYVCAGFEGFKKINYDSETNIQPWQAIGKATDHIHEGVYRGLQDYARKWPYNGANKIGAFYPSKTIRTSYQTPATQRASNDAYIGAIKPKVITVVRCLQNEVELTSKDEPHAKVKILLNRRGVHNLKQLNKDIGEAFGARYRDKKLERLYNIHGQEVLGVSDLFRGGNNSDDNDIFLGVCATDTISVKEVSKILQELFPRKSEYADEILKEWKKLHKRHKRKSAAVLAANDLLTSREDVTSGKVSATPASARDSKLAPPRQKPQDSGLGSDEEEKLKGRDQMVENEIEIMKRCNHANIIKLIEEFETPTELYLIMELVKGGDLFDAITQSVKFGETEASHMVEDLAKGIHYLHCRNIVHRDIKPENVMVHRNKDNSVTLKLGDFGLAMYVEEPIYTVCGTPTYVAPEILSEIEGRLLTHICSLLTEDGNE